MLTLFLGYSLLITAQTALLVYLFNARNRQNELSNDILNIKSGFSDLTSTVQTLTNDISEADQTVEWVYAGTNDRLNALQSLSDDFLELIGAQVEAITELELKIAEFEASTEVKEAVIAESPSTATEILTNMAPVRPYVEAVPTVEPTDPGQSLSENFLTVESGHEIIEEVTLPARAASTVIKGASRRRSGQFVKAKTPKELYTQALGEDMVQKLMDENSEVEDPEGLLKPPRKDGDPLITDLRATPFEEVNDGHGNIHDLPSNGGDYELWNSGGGRSGRTPRTRGFRRI